MVRICVVCFKRIPEYKPERNMTCKVQCSNAYYHYTGNRRIESKAKAIKLAKEINGKK